MTDADPERDRPVGTAIVDVAQAYLDGRGFLPPSEVRALVARVRELNAECEATAAATARWVEHHARAEQRIAELEQDARRLDWLETEVLYIEPRLAYQNRIGSDRASIDAAMAAERAEIEPPCECATCRRARGESGTGDGPKSVRHERAERKE